MNKKKTEQKTAGCCQTGRKRRAAKLRDDLDTVLEPAFFKALCDPGRVAMLVRLAQCCKPCSVTEVADGCPVDVSVVSRHLAMLRDAGLLVAQRKGKEVYYSVRYAAITTTMRAIADCIEACCPSDGGPAANKPPMKGKKR